MRQISAKLQAVQQVRSPQARVTVTVEARGQNAAAPAAVWRELVGNAGQVAFKPTAAVGLADGRILKWVAESSAIQQYTIATPGSAAGWTGASGVTVRSHGALALAALRIPGSNTVRLWYVHADNKVYYIESANQGTTWGSPVAVYSSADAAADLVVAYIDNGVTQHGPWFFGFSTYNAGTGLYAARFGYHDGAAWVTHAYGETGWRAAGIYPYLASAAHPVLVFRQQGSGASRLRTLTKTGAAYSDALDIDQTQAGHFGLGLAYFRFCQLAEVGCMLGVAGEYASGRGAYQGVCGLFHHDDLLVDETIIFPAIACADNRAHPCLCAAGGALYFVGDTVVYWAAAQTVPGAVLEPVHYTYDDDSVELEFAAGGAALGLAAGQILVVTRRLAWGELSGSESFRAWIVRVERATDRVRVTAVDAVGFLGLARCRRPSVLNDGTVNGCARVVRQLCARFGLAARSDDSGLDTAPVLPITLQPGESLRGALYRVRSQTALYVVPANDGAFEVTMITPPHSSVSGDYVDTPHLYGAAPSQQPLARAVAISDYRRLAFAYILGTYSTDPEDGAALAMAAGPVVDNTRPLAYALTNRRYNSAARVEQAATAEALRQRTLAVDAVIEGSANLSLELYDMVAVTEPALGWSAKQFRVRRIREVWERGRLTQTVYLGLDMP